MKGKKVRNKDQIERKNEKAQKLDTVLYMELHEVDIQIKRMMKQYYLIKQYYQLIKKNIDQETQHYQLIKRKTSQESTEIHYTNVRSIALLNYQPIIGIAKDMEDYNMIYIDVTINYINIEVFDIILINTMYYIEKKLHNIILLINATNIILIRIIINDLKDKNDIERLKINYIGLLIISYILVTRVSVNKKIIRILNINYIELVNIIIWKINIKIKPMINQRYQLSRKTYQEQEIHYTNEVHVVLFDYLSLKYIQSMYCTNGDDRKSMYCTNGDDRKYKMMFINITKSYG
eukprot:318750_1